MVSYKHTIWYLYRHFPEKSVFRIIITLNKKYEMETIKKRKYEAPTTDVIGVRVEGTILTISGDAPQYRGPYEF